MLAAIGIAIVSLLYTNFLVNKIAKEEKAKVKLWAAALQKRAELIKVTNQLFKDIAKDQRKDIELWARATELMTGQNTDPEFLTYLSTIVTSNTNIPAILTDKNQRVIESINIDIPKGSAYFLDTLLVNNFQKYKPIKIQFIGGENYIYYSDSKIFTQLKKTISNLTETFIGEIVSNSASLPVLLTNAQNQIIGYGNIHKKELQTNQLNETINQMKAQNKPIVFDFGDGDKHYLYYNNSFLLTQLKAFPFIQFFLFSLLIGVAYIGFSNSRKAEQNRVWVGMAKETAHQLGTPISSLSAWVDYMKEAPKDAFNNEQFVEEIEKDVNRLSLIAERFSKIGSKPDLKPLNIKDTLEKTMAYMQKRSSSRVKFVFETEESDLQFNINESLFNWVIENLVNNAIDAMSGEGQITLRSFHTGGHTIIDIIDTGKGIAKHQLETVFQPGFSTKKRGWGLGLSLVKRIIENYHKGRIFVKESSEKGTCFRIELPLVG